MSTILNPDTKRRIKVGGKIYNQLLTKGRVAKRSSNLPSLVSQLPSELLNELALRTSIGDIASVCYSNRYLRGRCNDRFFWINYINHKVIDTEYDDPQDVLHHLFVELAKQGDWTLFQLVWKADLQLIKEGRSLAFSYEAAYKNGKRKVADNIWKLNLSKDFSVSCKFHSWSKMASDCFLDAEIIAEKNDLKSFKKLIDRMFETRVYEAASYSNDANFIEGLVNYLKKLSLKEIVPNGVDRTPTFHYSPEGFVKVLLSKGKFELAAVVANLEPNELEEDEFRFSLAALNSSRDDSFTTVQTYNLYAVELTFGLIDRYMRGEGVAIGSQLILSDYAENYPEDHITLLNSFKTFPAKRFYNFYKKTAGCYTLEERNCFFATLKYTGHDYLYSLFDKGMSICD